jgi:hypothetical protein
MAGFCGRFADKREPRKPRTLAAAHGERIDVDIQAAEQRSHAREHTGQVFNVSDECMQHEDFLALQLQADS